MDSDLSTWKNTMGAIDIIRHFQNKVSTSRKDITPTLPPFMIGERWWEFKKELDLREGGGWIDIGAHNRDSVPAQFGNGCNATGAKVLTLLMAWSHHMKHNHNLTGGKHFVNRDGEQLSPEEREQLYKEFMEE